MELIDASPDGIDYGFTASVSDMHQLGFGACQAGKLVVVQEGHGSW